MRRTKRELQIEAYNQKTFTQEAKQKADDVGHSLNLLLNGEFRRFHTAITSDGSIQEFLVGIAKNVFIADPYQQLLERSQFEDRRIVLWKTTFESGERHGSAYHESEFKSLPEKLVEQSPELKKLLQEAIGQLFSEVEPLASSKNSSGEQRAGRNVLVQ